MPRRPPKLRPDVNETAFRTVQAATGQAKKPKPAGEGEPNPEAVKRGKKGGKARAKALSSERRTEIAKRGARTRWKDSAKPDRT